MKQSTTLTRMSIIVLLFIVLVGPLALYLRRRLAPRRPPPLVAQVASRAVAEVRKVGVVGLGAMGAGIAQLASRPGSTPSAAR